MAVKTYKLTYFNLRARREPARTMFTRAGQKFENIRVLPQNWENVKPGYLPDGAFERVHCNSVLHTLNDLSAFVSKNVFLSELCKMTAADITTFCSWMLIKLVFPWSEFNNDWLNKVMENMETDPKFAKYLQD
ncbi:hematopoietic prostaglandin D synthase-like [Watersipora subatra]|uniref:hematopoietic prostaglandin D synthase-like n=1 Tax=Watersipora subatra TaxID=2589382 RepID=UPI00355BB402